jgi:putative phosphoesterase
MAKRIGIFSDVHGNAHALTAILNDISTQSIDRLICLGDLFTLGPSPVETMHALRNIDCEIILGNHEQALLDPENAHAFELGDSIMRASITWCLEKLSRDDISFIKSFKNSIETSYDKRRIVLFHGSPISSIDKILPNTTEEDITKYFISDLPDIAVGGHTHIQMLRKIYSTLIINPGSVGCAFMTPSSHPPAPSFLPVAEYAIVTIDRDSISVDLKSISYDVGGFVGALRHSNHPLKSWWQAEFARIGIQ